MMTLVFKYPFFLGGVRSIAVRGLGPEYDSVTALKKDALCLCSCLTMFASSLS